MTVFSEFLRNLFNVRFEAIDDIFFSDLDGFKNSFDASGSLVIDFDDLLENDIIGDSVSKVDLELSFLGSIDNNVFNISQSQRTVTYSPPSVNSSAILNYAVIDAKTNNALSRASAYFSAESVREAISTEDSQNGEKSGIVAVFSNAPTDNFFLEFLGANNANSKTGSGFFISERSILTAGHVVRESRDGFSNDYFAAGASGLDALDLSDSSNPDSPVLNSKINVDDSNLLFPEFGNFSYSKDPRRSNDIAVVDVGNASSTAFGVAVFVDPIRDGHPLVTSGRSLETAGYPGNRSSFGIGEDGNVVRLVIMVSAPGVLTDTVVDTSKLGPVESYALTSPGLDASVGQSGSPAYALFDNPLDSGSDSESELRAVGVLVAADQFLEPGTNKETGIPNFTKTVVAPFTPDSFVEIMRWIEARGDRQPEGITNGIVGNDQQNWIPGSPWADVRTGGKGDDIFWGRPHDFDGDIFDDLAVGDYFQLEFAPGALSFVAVDAFTVNSDGVSETWDTVTLDVDGDGTIDAEFQAKLDPDVAIVLPDFSNAIKTDPSGNSYVTFQVVEGKLGKGFSPNGLSFVDVEEFVTATILGNPETSIRGSELRNIAITDAGRVFSVAEIEAGENDIIGIPPIFPGDHEIVLLEHDPETGSIIGTTELAEDFNVSFTEAVRALAPLPGGAFFAVGESFVGSGSRGQDFFFRIDPSGTTSFLGNGSDNAGGSIDNPELRIVSADTASDGSVYVWQDNIDSFGGGNLWQIDPDSGNGTLVQSFASPFEILSISFTPAGELLATGGDASGRASLFSIDEAAGTITQVALFEGSTTFAQEFEATGERPASSTQVATPSGGTINGTNGRDVIVGGDGIDIIAAGLGADLISTGRGDDRIIGTLQEFAGDIITDFSASDTLFFLNSVFGSPSIFLRFGSVFLDIDADLDGVVDSTVKLEGDFDPLTTSFDVEADGNGNTILTLARLNENPIAARDSLSVAEGKVVSFTATELLSNDQDPDVDDTLTITSLYLEGLQGVIAETAPGQFEYTASLSSDLSVGDTFIDRFSYTISDGRGGITTATVEIEVTGRDNLLALNDVFSLLPGQSLEISADSLAENDTNPFGDELQIIQLDTSTTLGDLSFNTNGNLSYQPLADFTGIDSFTYTISDSTGDVSSAFVFLDISDTVSNLPPVVSEVTAEFGEDETGRILELLDPNFVSDPDGDNLDVENVIVTKADGRVLASAVDPETGQFSLDDGQFEDLAVGASFVVTINYDVTDGPASVANVASVTITGANDAPIADDDSDATDEQTVIDINVLGNDTDIDGDTIFVSAHDTTGTLGLITDNGDGSFAYDPNGVFENLGGDASAIDSFAYTISDGNGGIDAATVTIIVNGVNDDPLASDDRDATNEDTAVNVDVLGNDTDVDGDTLFVSTVGIASNGTTDLNPDGTIRYTPNIGFDGTESFNYTVSDGNGGTDTATVTVSVNAAPNQPPVASRITAEFGEDDTDRTVNLLDLALVFDPDGDDLEVENVTVTTADGRVLSGTTDLETGLFSLDDGQFEDLASGALFDVTIDYDVSDRNASVTNTATVTITGANDSPVAGGDGGVGFGTDEDSAFTTASVLDNDSDVDGDTLSVGDLDTTITLGLVTNNGDGTFGYDPNGTFENLGLGERTTDSFSYTVFDGKGSTDTATVVIAVNGVNDDPVAGNDSEAIDEDTSVDIDVLGDDTDIDGDTLFVSTVGAAANGVTEVNSDGTIRYTPNTGFDGNDNFSYTVSDGNGGTDTAIVSIEVSAAPNQPPVVTMITAGFGEDDINRTINLLDPAKISDLDGDDLDIDSITVSTTDGRVLTTTTDPETGQFSLDDGQFEDLSAGETLALTINYDVTDGSASVANVASVTITGANDVPNADDDDGVGFEVDEDTSFTTASVLSNDSDVDGDAISISALDLTGTRGLVINNGDGTFGYDPNGAFESLGESSSATDSFSYTVSDGNGETDSATATISVIGVNDAPLAVSDNAVTDVNTSVNLDLTVNDLDIDGDALSIFVVGSPAQGTIAFISSETVRYTPDINFSGTESFFYIVTDGNGGRDTANVTVSVQGVNDLPLARGDFASTDADVPVDIDVLNNDSDIDGDLLSVLFFGAPTNGIVTFNADNTIRYTPDVGFDGTDSFFYIVSDGNGGTDTAIVTVEVVGEPNIAPTATDIFETFGEDTLNRAVNLLETSTDPDGDDLDISNIFTSTGDGRAITTILDSETGLFTIIDGQFEDLSEGASLSVFVDYVITDGEAFIPNAATITIIGANDAPEATDDLGFRFETDENTAFRTTSILANDVDVDGDPITIVSVDTSTMVGALTDNGNGSFDYDPNGAFESLRPGQDATDSFTYTVSDGSGGTDTATVTITINGVDDAPVANDDSATTNEGVAIDIDVLASDTDIDGGALSVSTVGSAANGVTSVNPDGSIRYVPDAGFSGIDSFTYSASNISSTVHGTQTVQSSAFVGEESQEAFFNLSVAEFTDDGTTPVSGTISLTSVIQPNLNVLFVFDDSLSTTAPFGGVSPGDQNGNGFADEIIDAQILSLINLRGEIAALGFNDESVKLGLVAFNTDATILLNDGSELDVEEESDFSGLQITFEASLTELDDVLRSRISSGTTNYDDALEGAVSWFRSTDADEDDLNVIYFLSDGFPNVDGDDFSDEIAILETEFNAQIVAVGVGSSSSLLDLNTIDNTGGAEQVTSSDDLDRTLLGNPFSDAQPVDFRIFVDGVQDTEFDITDLSSNIFGFEIVPQTLDGLVETLDSSSIIRAEIEFEDGTILANEATVSTPSLNTDTATVTVEVIDVNEAPIAIDDFGSGFSTLQSNILTTPNVLNNDSDPDGDPLAVFSVDVTGTLGLVTDNGDGTFEYDPNGAFSGLLEGETSVDSFSYTVTDGNGGTDTATVDITVSAVEPVGEIDVVFLQDLSLSFADDLPLVQTQVASIFDKVSTALDAQFGVASFIDKPTSPFGQSPTDYVYQTDLKLSANRDGVLSAIDNLVIGNGLDSREAQLEALLQLASKPSSEIGFRTDAQRIVILSTDAGFHVAGDFPIGPNDGDDQAEIEDYPSVGQLRLALDAADITPIFSVTPDQISTYEALVEDLGRGAVVELSSSSEDLMEAFLSITEIEIENTPPVALDDSGFVVQAGQSLTIGSAAFLGNDLDANDDILSLVSIGEVVGGSALVTPTDSIVFTADGDVEGEVVFSYTITDGVSQSTANISVTVLPETDPVNVIDAASDQESHVGTTSADVFVFEQGDSNLFGMDSIEDFEAGDRIDLTAFGFDSVLSSQDERSADSVALVGGDGGVLLISTRGFSDFLLQIDGTVQDVLDGIDLF